MSYNNRTGPGVPKARPRRSTGNPSVGQNFISGGQLANPLNQSRPPQSIPSLFEVNDNQFIGALASVQKMNTRSQQQQQQQQQQQYQGTFLQQQSNIPNHNQSSSQIMVQDEVKEESSQTMTTDKNTTEQKTEKQRPFPFKTGGKISKKERQRRRNNRLSRILQPKNSVMILNELIKDVSYNLTELPQPNQYQFMASVQVGEESHVGYGHSKMEAKASASEAALKSIVKNRNFNQLTQTAKDVDGDEKMEQTDATLPWQHIASFALFKLLNEWGEAPFQANLSTNSTNSTSMDQSDGLDNSMNDETMQIPPQNRPAKRMPDNAVHMNPLMLLNQMLPHAQFEELGRSGDPPNLSFTFKCTVNGESFIGSGSSKKAAKKAVAFQVCHKILSVQYPPEIYTPNA